MIMVLGRQREMCVILDKKGNMQMYSSLRSLHVNKHSLATNQSPISQRVVSCCSSNDLHSDALLRYKYVNEKLGAIVLGQWTF